MRLLVRTFLLVFPLAVLAGCDSGKPQPAQTPKEIIPNPKSGPVPGGGGDKVPANTSQLSQPAATDSVAA